MSREIHQRGQAQCGVTSHLTGSDVPVQSGRVVHLDGGQGGRGVIAESACWWR